MRRFPAPWTIEKIPGGFKVLDANGQSLAYVYSRETKDAADLAKVLTEDEALRIASNIAKLPVLLGKARPNDRFLAAATTLAERTLLLEILDARWGVRWEPCGAGYLSILATDSALLTARNYRYY